MANGVMIIAEQRSNTLRKITCEAASAGKKLAAELGEPLMALVMGAGVKQCASELERYGVERIIVADDQILKSFQAEAYTNVVCDLIDKYDPRIVVMGATSQGKELTARVAARLQVGLAMECTSLKIQDNTMVASRPLYGGRAIADVAIEGTPQMATIRPNVFELTEVEGSAEMAEVEVNIGELKVELVEESIEVSSKVELTEADYVISGGRGLGGPDFTLLEELAALLGGAIGASRNAVDAGWRPQSDQVGQTGKVVSPKLYMACGISGAMQHTAGMSTSDTIVAINNDPDALIFRTADYCIVDDLFEVVPAINNEIRKFKG